MTTISPTLSRPSSPRYVYIYDKRGLEVHCLREHEQTLGLEFLQRFFLLASVGEAGIVRWQDTSTGALVAQHRTRLGACRVLRGNPHNGVLLCGHGNGSVTMWSPNMGSPLVSMLCHRGAVRCCAVDPTGRYLVTGGADAQVKVWDVRNYKPLHAYFSATPAASCDISQRGMLAVAYGPHVQVWADALGAKAKAPYVTHQVAGGATSAGCARFCPYEDILGVGHSGGMASLLVRGRGGRGRNGAHALEGHRAAGDHRRDGNIRKHVAHAAPRGRNSDCAATPPRWRWHARGHAVTDAGPVRDGTALSTARRVPTHTNTRSSHRRPTHAWHRPFLLHPPTTQVPGSGEPNYDTYVANPNETKKQRQEAEVHALLDKLQPAMIMLDPNQVGGLMHEPREVQIARRQEQAQAEAAGRREAAAVTDAKKKMKGRRKPTARHRRKQLNVVDEKRAALLEQERLRALASGGGKKGAAGRAAPAPSRAPANEPEVPFALRRFVRKTPGD